MYKLTVLNKFGKISVITSDDLERLKTIAKRMNKNECDIEITKEVCLFRIVSMK